MQTGLEASAAAATARTLFFGFRWIDDNLPVLNCLSVEQTDGIFRLCLRRHLHKSKTTLAPGFSISGDGDGYNLASLREQILQISLCQFKAQVTNKQFRIH